MCPVVLPAAVVVKVQQEKARGKANLKITPYTIGYRPVKVSLKSDMTFRCHQSNKKIKNCLL